MVTLHTIFIVAYIVFLLTFAIQISRAKKAFIGYSIKDKAISALGMQVSPHYKRFNALVIAFGAMTGPFAILLGTYLEPSLYTTISTSSMLLASIFSILVGLFPFDTKPMTHHMVAWTLFLFAFISTVLLGVPIVATSWIPNYFVILNVVFGLVAIILLYGFTRFHFTRKWIKRIWLYEWISFVLIFVHNLTLSILLLLHLNGLYI